MIIYLLHTVYMFLSIEENIKDSPVWGEELMYLDEHLKTENSNIIDNKYVV